MTDLHRALAHSLKTRMGRGSIFSPEIRREKFEQEVTGMTDFNQKTHDTDVGSHGGRSRQITEVFENQELVAEREQLHEQEEENRQSSR